MVERGIWADTLSKNLEGDVRGLFQGSIQEFAWRDCRKPGTLCIRVASSLIRIIIGHPNTKRVSLYHRERERGVCVVTSAYA